jgi:hypothetical protein
MRVALIVGLCRSRFSCFYSDSKKWHCGDRSCASLVLVAHQSTARPVTSSSLPMMTSVLEVLSAGGASQGTADVVWSVLALG